ncbi:TonB-dependent receptor, partial [Deltaproteobacteria bacterium]|nr:TonB-dependent receptor [Deltaproteobacteria bacterium]
VYILGLSYYRVTDRIDNVEDIIQSPLPGDVADWSKIDFETEAKAAYGNVTIPMTDQFRFTVGLRTSEDSFHSKSTSYPPRYGTYGDPMGKEEGTMTYSGTDYKIGLEYDVGENAMFYTDYSTSYRTQGMAFRWPSDPNQVASGLPPEKLKAFNLGYKSRFYGNRFQFNVAGYYYDYIDYFAQGGQRSVSLNDINDDGDYDDPGEIRTVMDEQAKSVGDAKVYGVDVSASMIITSQDKLDVTVSSNRKYFTSMLFDYTDATNDFVGIPDKDLAGWPMTYSPTLTFNAAYSHNFNLENGDMITARIDAKYQSEYLLDWETYSVDFDPVTYMPLPAVYTQDISTQEPHYISNITAVYADAEGKWTFTTYMKNITNYAAKLHGRGTRSLNISAPRTYGAILSIKY